MELCLHPLPTRSFEQLYMCIIIKITFVDNVYDR